MSTINTGSINISYPTPGVNNSSQGFRDNFTSIKNNLDTAGTEITELQNKAIVKSALSGITLDNDMNNTLISNAQTLRFRGSTYALGNNLSGVVTIDLTKGDLQYGTVTGNATLEFSKWAPSGTSSTVTVYLSVASPSIQITLPAAATVGSSTLENYQSNTVTVLGSLGLDIPSVLAYQFSTYDCGTTITVTPVNRPRKATQLTTTVPTTSKGAAGDRTGQIAVNSSYIFVCTGNYDGTTDIWKRVTLTGGVW
jgi:hypothetical protein